MSKPRKLNPLVWLRWHRRFGAAFVVVVVALSVTGILINHTDYFQLHKKPVYSSLVAKLYGYPIEKIEQGFQLDDHWFVLVNEQLFLNQQSLMHCGDVLFGVVQYQEDIAVLCKESLLLLDSDGELVERLPGITGSSSKLGLQGEFMFAQANGQLYQFDDDLAEWGSARTTMQLETDIDWSEPRSLPESLVKALQPKVAIKGLSWEQVLLDLHSGRLFGQLGVWVVDLTGIVLVLLGISGMVTYLNRIARRAKR